ncbi:3'-5' exonuclease [Nocardioides limicola]|uniref:3'-5' exonuclease n=1 Tax=Nocardioides limicola TaxID=2803368 RepID=UPI00193C2631|nr:3'-5' exonuclease [Nocardioides sp. DJM-14]
MVLPKSLFQAAAVRTWARWMVWRRAVIIDTETTTLHGRICELAVADARGTVLLDTLVDPGCPIDPAATAVHGIHDADVAGAPTVLEVLPQLRALVGRRPILAYNAPYDRAVLTAEADRTGFQLGRLGRRHAWGCLMRARALQEGRAWCRLDGGHRAAGDARAASRVLRSLANLL